MIRVSVLYPAAEGARFDADYYCQHHLPLVAQLFGGDLQGSEANIGVGAAAPFMAIGHLLFESVEAFQGCISRHGRTVMADLANFTNVEPVIQVSEVR